MTAAAAREEPHPSRWWSSEQALANSLSQHTNIAHGSAMFTVDGAGNAKFSFAGFVRAALCAMVMTGTTLCLVQCSSEQGEGENVGSVSAALEHCGGISCSGNADCQVNVPLCAQSISATCLPNPPRECAWKLAISSSCPCMEHDVRLCTQGNGSPSVQICTANAARTATFWDACIACPSCSP
jgi:hypothetical protein